ELVTPQVERIEVGISVVDLQAVDLVRQGPRQRPEAIRPLIRRKRSRAFVHPLAGQSQRLDHAAPRRRDVLAVPRHRALLADFPRGKMIPRLALAASQSPDGMAQLFARTPYMKRSTTGAGAWAPRRALKAC